MLKLIKFIKIFAMLLYNSTIKFESFRNKMIKYLLKLFIINFIYKFLLKYLNLIKNTMIFRIVYRLYKFILLIGFGIIGLDFSYLYFGFNLNDLSHWFEDLPKIIENFCNKIHNFIKKIIDRIKGKNDEDYCGIDFTDYIYSVNDETDNNYEEIKNVDNNLNPYYIFILSIILKLTVIYYGDSESNIHIIIDNFFKDYVPSYIIPEFTYKVIYAILFSVSMKYCNEINIALNLEDEIKDNIKDVSNQDNNSVKEDNIQNENNIEDNNSNKSLEDRIKEIKDSREIDSSVSSPIGNHLSEEDRFYYNSIFQKEKDLEDKKNSISNNINTLEEVKTNDILDNEETPKSSPNKFLSYFQIENKWSSNKDSKFIAGNDINEMQANLNKEIEDLNKT